MNAARSIVLIGMMGAGKSSVGRCLQRSTGLARFDLDEMIANAAGKPITEIFAQEGEEKFRDTETETLRKLKPDRPAIIVTGGGIVNRSVNIDLLKQLGAIVWLTADEKTLFDRASRRNTRPLLQNENPRSVFTALLQKRESLYAAAADLRIDTTAKSHDEVADEIVVRLENIVRQ